jgi:hypothetical protein
MYIMGFEIVEFSVLKLSKEPIQAMGGLADHYYLAETLNANNSIGWGPHGLELRGLVKITAQELERIEIFTAAAQYSMAVNNCEHFANYILYGINFSSQRHLWWKYLGAEIIALLQPVQTMMGNYNAFIGEQASRILSENLRQARIDKANKERIEFWKSRGVL